MSPRLFSFVVLASLASQSVSARAQTTTHRPLVGGEVTGIELGLEGELEAPPGGRLRWLMTLHDIVGSDELRPAVGGQIRVLASYRPEEPVAVIQTDRFGRAQVELTVPEDFCCSFDVIFEAQTRSHVQRRFQVTVALTESHRVEVDLDRTTCAPGERITLFGRVWSMTSGTPIAQQQITLRFSDEEGRTVLAERQLTTDAAGTFLDSFEAPQGVASVEVTARLGSGQSGQASVAVRRALPPDLVVLAAPTLRLIRPGESVPIDVIVRRTSGVPLQGAVVMAPDEDESTERGSKRALVRTDEHGRARVTWRPSSSALADGVEDAAGSIVVTHPGYGVAERPVTVRVARRFAHIGISVEGGALVQGLPGRIYLRVVGSDGEPMAAGVPVRLESELLGDLTGATDEAGVVLLEGDVEIRPGAAGRDRCGGATASAVRISIGEPSEAAQFERCLPVDPDATLRVRAEPRAVEPGGTVRVSLIRASSVRREPVVVALLRRRGDRWAPLHQQVVPSTTSELTIEVPGDARGELLIRARPLLGTDRQELRGGSELIWVTPGRRFAVEATAAGPGSVQLGVNGGDQQARTGLLLLVPAAEGDDLIARLRSISGEPGASLVDPSRSPGAMLAGLLASRTPRDDAAPAVLREGEAVTLPAPDSPVDHGVLRDPWRARARFVRGRLGLVMRALEHYASEAIPGEIESVATRTGRGWSFNLELLRAVASSPLLGSAGANGLSGEPLTLEDLQELDPAFTFDNMARRVTRERLLRVLIALRSFVRQHDLDLQWTNDVAADQWLAQLRDYADEESGEVMVSREQLIDGWGRPMAIRRVPAGRRAFAFLTPLPQEWELVSAGPDGRFGSGDDFRDPFARVLPSGGAYAEAVAEDDLLARLRGVELGQATLQQLLEVFEVQNDDDQGSERLASELDWSDVPGPIAATDDLSWFERNWEQVRTPPTRGFSVEQDRVEVPIRLGDEPRRYTAVGLVSSPDGWRGWDRIDISGGSPLLVDAPLPSRIRLGEEVAVNLSFVRLAQGVASLRVALSSTEQVEATLGEGASVADLRFSTGWGQDLPIRITGRQLGRGTLRVTLDDPVSRFHRVLEIPIRVDDGLLLRSQVAAMAVDREVRLPLEIPRDAADPEAWVVITSSAGLTEDPGLTRWRDEDPALLAWAHVFQGREIPEEISRALASSTSRQGAVSGLSQRISTACAAVAWSATERHDLDLPRARSAAIRWLVRQHQQIQRERARGDEATSAMSLGENATILVVLASGASGLPDTQGRAQDPVSAYVGQLRDEVRSLIRSHRADLGLLSRGAAGLLLIDRRDARGRAMLALARDHLVRGLRGGLVVDLPNADQREQLVATAALAIAATQVGDSELAGELARGMAARAPLAMSLGGEPLFWLLAAATYGALGQGSEGGVVIETRGERHQVDLSEGVARFDLAGDDLHRLDEVVLRRTDPGSDLLLARIEARYTRPQHQQDAGPLRASLEGDPGFAGERAAYEVTLSNVSDARVEGPVLLVSLPSSATLEERVRLAMINSPSVETVAEPDARGVVEIHLVPLEPESEAVVPLPLRWIAAGSVSGLGLAVFADDRPWELSVTPDRELTLERRAGSSPP